MPRDPHPDWRSYLAILCGGGAVTIAALLALNYVVDPYLIHQWDTPQVMRLRPAREKMSAWGKTYALARFQPSILYLGNSRTELGMPTSIPLFAGQDVFNGALSGASLGDTVAMAQHALAINPPHTVIWGIDAPSFSVEVGNTDFDRALVAQGGFYQWRRRLLDLKRALTVDMTRDSLSVLMGTFGAVCHSSLAFHGQRDDGCMRSSPYGGWAGTRAAVVPRTREFVRGSGPTRAAYDALEQTVGAMCQAGARVRLYVNPTHAMMADALYWAGKWPAQERWQTSLAAMAAVQRGRGCDVRVYDFSGFNSVTTEAIPQATRHEYMANYWEPSHYRVNVGRMVLGRMFGDAATAIPDDFGLELTPAAMPAHLAAMRAGRERYHAEHVLETTMARDIAAEQLALARARRSQP
ncbi:hypothetical protein [Rugamonas apoptosis]|uniref:Uncharacterized protein n=1 Tax=Rugamonas apoptosis TaxID=2758570 RepID=A0A7W2F8W1_9BURK|nr:hypothetical protein [Rugamonas apoptosis]MBA5687280.1 hypothetical protein [Rugamonas apoptosis]